MTKELIPDRTEDTISVALVFNDDGASKVAEGKMLTSRVMDGVYCVEYQDPEGGAKKGAHNAGRNVHGDVTHLQLIVEGGFHVGIGRDLTPHHFTAPILVAFTDADGGGHDSEVDPDGCKRVYMQRRGHLTRDMFLCD